LADRPANPTQVVYPLTSTVPRMPTRPRVYPPQVLGLFLATIGYFSVAGLSFPVLPRLVERELGGSKADIGLVFGLLAVGMLFARPVASVMSDRYGRRPLMIVGSLIVAVAQIGHMLAADTGHLWVLFAVRVLTGAGSSAMYLALATTATELPSPEHRDRVFAVFSTMVLVGFAIGQTSGEWVMQEWGFWSTYLMATGFALLTTLVAVTLPETRPDHVVAASKMREVFHPVAARVGLVNLMVFTAFMGFNAFIADYAEEFGMEQVRWLLLLYSGTTVAMRLLQGRVMALFPRRTLVSIAQSLVIAGVLILATAGGTGQLYLGAFVFALGLAWNVPLMILIAVDSADEADRSKVVATVTTFGDIASSAGTLALGFIAESFGYDGMYFVIGALVFAGLVLVRSPFLSGLAGMGRIRAEPVAPAASRT
jgi:MFS family permease